MWRLPSTLTSRRAASLRGDRPARGVQRRDRVQVWFPGRSAHQRAANVAVCWRPSKLHPTLGAATFGMEEDAFELVGTRVAGVFHVERVVAEGGFGVVYRAHHTGFNAKVALKCLKIPQHMSEQKRARFKAQFRAEAQLLFRLSAAIPNIVRPLHIDAIVAPNGRFMPFMALEWLEGKTFEALSTEAAEEGRTLGPIEELVRLLTPAAVALQRAHHFPSNDGPISIVHRDIKPENLFLARIGGQQVVKVLDFGIGKARSAATQAVGKTSASSGGISSFTPAFGAPEQWVPKRYGQTGPWTDVWGLALTTVELLVGRPVLDGDQASMMGAALDPKRRPTPRAEGVEVSDEVERVFTRALAVDPRDRYPDAGAFWAELVSAVTQPSGTSAVSSASASSSTRHAELELDDGRTSLPLELASIPPTESQAMRAVAERGALKAARVRLPRAASVPPQPRFSDIPIQLPALSIRPSAVVWRDCLVPIIAIAAGVILAGLGQYYAATSGQVFTVGPIRLGWFTVPMVVAGSATLLLRLLRR